MQGRSIEKLSKILGHYSVIVTERYAHLRPDLFIDEERAALPLDRTRSAVELGTLEPRTSHGAAKAPATKRMTERKAGAAL